MIVRLQLPLIHVISNSHTKVTEMGLVISTGFYTKNPQSQVLNLNEVVVT